MSWYGSVRGRGRIPPQSSGASGGLPLLFSDGFESGDLSHTQNGVSWAGSTNAAVSTNKANGGAHSLMFTFNTATANAEQRFNLGAPYTELIFTWDEYIPNGSESYGGAAYSVANVSPNNDKFLRLWRGDQADGNNGYTSFWTKAGASTTRNMVGSDIANLVQEYGKDGGGVGQFGSGSQSDAGGYTHYITNSDLGTWLAVKMHIKAATAAGNDGVIETWKNGVQVISGTALDIYPAAGAAHNGFDFGYLLGFANSFVASGAPTRLSFIDNVNIYGQ